MAYMKRYGTWSIKIQEVIVYSFVLFHLFHKLTEAIVYTISGSLILHK